MSEVFINIAIVIISTSVLFLLSYGAFMLGMWVEKRKNKKTRRK